MPAVTRTGIVRSLREMGLREGDILMAHSALSSFGTVTGGARTVVDALLDVMGKTGTLLMPTLTSDRPYNYRTSRSTMGAITEDFRKRPGVLRSLNPCVPACGIGPRAKDLLENHHKCECPYIGSPYDLAAKAGGYVLLLGVDQDRNTTLHCAEAYANAPYLKSGEAKYVDARGKLQTYRYSLGAGPHRDFIGIDPLLRQAGIVKVGRIGNCVVRLMKAQAMIDFCVAEIKKNPAFFITSNDGYYDGIMQRGMIRRARIGTEESFKLTIRTGCAGSDLEEVLWHAERAGACGLDFDIINGLDATGYVPEKAAALPRTAYAADETALLLRRIKSRGLRICTVRCIAQPENLFNATVQTAKALEAEAVICPLTGSTALLKSRLRSAHKAGLQLLFENVAISSKAAEELLESVPGASLAFNPANFASAGELPFLQSIKPLKKYVGYLAINDMRPMGVPCIPGTGNGEIKELISILRCSRFGGFFSIGAEPYSRLDFGQVTDAFWKLMDAC